MSARLRATSFRRVVMSVLAGMSGNRVVAVAEAAAGKAALLVLCRCPRV